MSLPLWMRLGKDKFIANSPTILSGLAVGGLVATVAFAIRATPGALEKVREAKEKKTEAWEAKPGADDDLEGLTYPEIVKAAWKCYIPAGVAGVASIACIVGANQVGLRQKAALAGAYSLAELAFREYKDEVIKQLGATKEQKVGDAIAERKVRENAPDAQVIIIGGDDQLCYDELTGRYFRSTAEKIRQAELDLRTNILKDMWCDHNYFYSLLDLEDTLVGDALGWNIEHQPEIIFSSHLSPSGQPCLAIRFKHLPKVDYLSYH